MKTKAIIPALLVTCGLAVSGCDTLLGKDYSIFNERAQTVGVSQLIDKDAFESIYLPALLNPGAAREKEPEKVGVEIDKGFEHFTTTHGEKFTEYELRRNAVQDRILASSVQRCNFYTRYLKRVDQTTNLALGSLATITGAAGAIVTGAGAARALAGIAGIFSGVRAEFNENLFASLAIHAITAGIDARRAEIRAEIVESRENAKKSSDYTVQAAVMDALRYHGACNLVAGLKAAGAAAERAADPGQKALERQVKQFEKTRKAMEDAIKPTGGPEGGGG